MTRRITEREESVTDGREHLGTISVRADGCHAFGPAGQFVGSFETVEQARRALLDMHLAASEIDQ